MKIIPIFNKPSAETDVRSKRINDKYAKYQQSPNGEQELLEHWQKTGQAACRYGTLVHHIIEYIMRGGKYTDLLSYNIKYILSIMPDDELKHILQHIYANSEIITDVEITETARQFYEFYSSRVHQDYYPFVVEMPIFDRDFPICGTIDSLFATNIDEAMADDPTTVRRVVMYDWKTCRKNLSDENSKSKTNGIGPASSYPNTALYKYFLQQNIYRYILEKSKNCYRVCVDDMYLVVFNVKDCINECHKVPRFSDSKIEQCISSALSYRAKKLSSSSNAISIDNLYN